ncbi:hypothetical protein RSSM_01241 [Rhodopirellula sallentina SM41]|uniref:Uncharacterized protein n=1 Tax=Rhodopirellula sallentina SM41 TaxID=1263870 RepID=M5U7I2_9BACT|nr:hypothetical protein RSSM_01241 [Rhodopirellula sallentina SM41]
MEFTGIEFYRGSKPIESNRPSDWRTQAVSGDEPIRRPRQLFSILF